MTLKLLKQKSDKTGFFCKKTKKNLAHLSQQLQQQLQVCLVLKPSKRVSLDCPVVKLVDKLETWKKRCIVRKQSKAWAKWVDCQQAFAAQKLKTTPGQNSWKKPVSLMCIAVTLGSADSQQQWLWCLASLSLSSTSCWLVSLLKHSEKSSGPACLWASSGRPWTRWWQRQNCAVVASNWSLVS